MKATVLLADSAQTDASQKVHALGLGWSVTSTPTPPAALVVMLKVPWTEADRRHTVELTLVDADGHVVTFGGDQLTGVAQSMQIRAEFEVGRPPGLPEGTPIDQSFTVNLGPGMELAPGRTYEWRLDVDGRHEEGWTVAFHIRP